MKIPITVITGFLGVGKTTLVHNLLKNNEGKRIAVLVNEFGEVGVDGEIIKSGCGDDNCDLIELANGCICCTVQEEFLPTMLELIERKENIDHIVIETSGLAMPKPLVRAVNWPDLKPHITVDAVVTVVDAVGAATGEFCDRERVQQQRLEDDSLDHETPIEELFKDQLTCADLVLISKSDLIEEDKLKEIEEMIKGKVRSNTKMIPMVKGDISSSILLGIGASAEDDLDNRHSIHEHHHEHGHDHDHDDSIVSDLLIRDETSDIKELVKELKTMVRQNEIYRIKGAVHIPGKNMRMVLQGVGERFDYYFDRLWNDGEERKTKLVVIYNKEHSNLEFVKEQEAVEASS